MRPDPPLAKIVRCHKGVIITIYNDPIDEAKAVSLIYQDRIVLSLRPPILPALRSKTLNIAGNYYGTTVARQAPNFLRAAAVLGNGEIVDKFNFKQHTNGNLTVHFFLADGLHFCLPSD